MILERVAKNITKPIIVVQSSDLGHDPKPFKCLVVEFIYEGEVWVRNHHIWQFLDISQTVRNPVHDPKWLDEKSLG